ncbi:MAG: DUF3536 domain-containing protein [Euzebyales bacterium]|nr:DUF3536 domain-containing protein [Euzebyales bacterium]
MQPFILHAHFYQPERTNPWTQTLDPEPSAAPFRDWNERVHAECYRPNGTARIFDTDRRVERIVNNYERLSFNFGPTLLRWMERRHPETYAKVLDGDWRATALTGHGNALAQAYNHMILPLATARDRRTQIRWGMADFRHRFNRQAEGMWLPETAANPATLDALIDEGVRFTILAPHQAHRVRRHATASDAEPWHDVGAGIDTGRAYRHHHRDGSGRTLTVCFYDGALAQSLAFDPNATEADVLVERLKQSTPGHAGLVHAALDGETFGHHHAFGELGLAYTLFEAAEREGLRPTSYGAWLAEHPPLDDVEIVQGEGTAWSCAHGLGRWYRDCGCATDSEPGWNQAWRTPLRAALDVVRDAAAEAFEVRGAALAKDPWAARDDYVHVQLGDLTPAQFLERHALRHLGDRQRTDLWTLLEAQRHAMVAYTSCGWFFADVAGIESVYVMRSAARVLGLLAELGVAGEARTTALEHLSQARSNRPGAGTGADVWRAKVESSEVTPTRIAAHLALVGLARPEVAATVGADGRLGFAGHHVTVRDRRLERRGRVTLGTARMTVASTATGRATDLAVAALHLGGLDFHGVVANDPGAAAFGVAADRLWQAFPAAPLARVIGALEEVLPRGDQNAFGVEQALPQGRQEIVGEIVTELTDRFREQYGRLYHDHRRVLEMLSVAGYELPDDVRLGVERALAAQLHRQLGTAATDDLAAFRAMEATVEQARSQGHELDLAPVAVALTRAVTGAARTASASLSEPDVAIVQAWLTLSGDLGVDLDLSRAQEHAYEAAVRAKAGRLGPAEADTVARLGAALGLSPVAWSVRHHSA